MDDNIIISSIKAEAYCFIEEYKTGIEKYLNKYRKLNKKKN